MYVIAQNKQRTSPRFYGLWSHPMYIESLIQWRMHTVPMPACLTSAQQHAHELCWLLSSSFMLLQWPSNFNKANTLGKWLFPYGNNGARVFMHVCVWECLLVFLMLWGHLFTKSHCEDSFPFLDAKATHLKITLKISPGLMLWLYRHLLGNYPLCFKKAFSQRIKLFSFVTQKLPEIKK